MTGAINGATPVSLASAATVNIGAAAANDVTITGTTTITAFDTIAAGAKRELTFSGVLTLTHNATSLILPNGGSNITTAAGDVAEFISLGAGNWRCTNYTFAAGGGSSDPTKLPLAGGTMTGAINYAPAVTIASAATPNIAGAAAQNITITGTATISGFSTSTDGVTRVLTFASAGLNLTHNAASMILPGGANIITQAGDVAEFVCIGTTNWRCIRYQRADGSSIKPASGTLSGALNFATPTSTGGGALTDLGAQNANDINISGTGISFSSFGTSAAGTHRTVTFTGAGTNTIQNNANIILPGGANITTAQGDVAELVSQGAGVWKCEMYTKANGQTLLPTLLLSGGTMTGAINEATAVSLASAATVNIGAAASNNITVTGTTTITAFDTIAAGAHRTITFSGILTLTHNATSLILPGAANITTANGDVADFVSLGSGNWRCVFYSKADGTSVVSGGGSDPTKLPLAGGTMSGQVNFAPTVTLASAATVNIGAAASNSVTITGTTGINAFDTVASGITRYLVFTGNGGTIGNNANIILPTGANITFLTGDTAEFISQGGGVWKCLWYQRKDGSALTVNDATKLPLAGGTMTGAINYANWPTIASALTTDIGVNSSNNILISGSNTITSFGSTAAAGTVRKVRFSGAPLLGTGIGNLPGGANIQAAANDTLEAMALGGGLWQINWYTRANGQAVIPALPLAGGTMTGAANWATPVSLASAATVAIGAAASNNVTITGTTTITAFDTIAAGAHRTLTFSGALTLTHNSTSLILPGGINITTANGDAAEFVSLGSGNWRCVDYTRANAVGGLSYNGETVVSTTGTLTAQGVAGRLVVGGSGSATTQTLPLANTVPVGTAIAFFNSGAGAMTVQRQGTDTLDGAGGGTSIVLAQVDSAVFESNGVGTWRLIGGTAQLPFIPSFGKSLASSGYQKLPGGLIIQWGQVNTSSSAETSFTFPIAFPTAVYQIGVTYQNGAGSGAFIGSVGATSTTAADISGYNTSGARVADHFTVIAIGS
jgi:hypothetical protein